MSVEIKGLDMALAEIERRLGADAMQKISDDALKEAAAVFEKELLSQLSTFSGVAGTTGATKDEVTFTEPYDLNGVRTITVHWSGPKQRYRIIHLNEYGTVNNPNPRGKGAIARALRNAETAYKKAIEDTIAGAF